MRARLTGKIIDMADSRHAGLEQDGVRAVICADDFAMTAGISRSILELAEAGCISATGAMTNRPHWPVWGARLRELRGHIDIGLHFNLTCAQPLTAMPYLAPDGHFPELRQVMLSQMLSSQAKAEIAAELRAQLEAFETVAGFTPDFVDGHQHVHAMPGIRSIVLAVLSERYPGKKPYLRDPGDSWTVIARRGVHVFKACIIAALGYGFGQRARALGFATNAGFSGVSAFDENHDFRQDMAVFLSLPGKRHLVMVHPGYIDDELARIDPVVNSRPCEHEALLDLQACGGFSAVKFSELS
jgi:chitin disaccharide deacetylase